MPSVQGVAIDVGCSVGSAAATVVMGAGGDGDEATDRDRPIAPLVSDRPLTSQAKL